jgi:hypothetical protein
MIWHRKNANSKMRAEEARVGTFYAVRLVCRGLASKRRQGAPLAARTSSAGARALLKFMARQA